MTSPTILPLTGLPLDQLPPDVLVCGDPGRAETITDHLVEPRLLSRLREYHTYVGHYRDMPVAVCSHGIGAPGAAIAFEELIHAGAKRLIRVGTCGSLQPGVDSGQLVIASGAVANTGYAEETVPRGYPAVADFRLTNALNLEAERSGHLFSIGLVVTRDCFYAGVAPAGVVDYDMMSKANVIAVEMECAALFIVGSLRQVQTGAILAVDGNVLRSAETMESYNPHTNVVAEAVEAEISIALEALYRNSHGAD